MQTKEKNKKVRKARNKSTLENGLIEAKSVAQFFGINKKEVDGLSFQKKVRNEWQ